MQASEAAALISAALTPSGQDPIELAAPPEPLTQARSATLFRFRLLSGPESLLRRDLVLRVLPSSAGTLAEAVIQREVGALGFPAPEVLHAGTTNGHRLVVMPAIAGQPLFKALGVARGFRALPVRLADLMRALHDLDPQPVRVALTAIDSGGAIDATARSIGDLSAALGSISHPARGPVCEWLEEHRPHVERSVVCHGDLHALNIVTEGTSDVLIDWELAGLAEPAFDVARTVLLMSAVPIEMSRVARPLIQRLARRSARQFQEAYLQGRPLSRASLEWFGTLHAVRMAAVVLAEGHTHDPALAAGAEWRPTLPYLVSYVRDRTGIDLTVSGA
jgi:aminoglycoside phosphotransferase (APT) family kinase protein